jgi:SAM-dependent MidA family methyltransferase
VFADYGADRTEYYRTERNQGTLRCHYRQRAHDDPLRWPGLQDITAWVDFDALECAAAANGLASLGSSPQAQFLVAHGLEEVFAQAHAACTDETARYRLAQEVKRLTLPGEMGERFRVVTLRRGA